MAAAAGGGEGMTQRPYPNVIPTENGRFEARLPRNGKQQHLGTFDTAEEAYAAVLDAQAEGHLAKAREYRYHARRLRRGR